MIALETLEAIFGTKLPLDGRGAVYPALCDTLTTRQIDTPLRMAMFIAQAGHESGGFRWLEELASGQAYENNADLGNTQPGDGVKFKGRGLFQVTGRANYGRCSTALFGSATLLLDQPQKLSEPRYAAESAGWFWDWKKLSPLADLADILGVTKRINGGTTGLADRIALYKRACTALGVRS